VGSSICDDVNGLRWWRRISLSDSYFNAGSNTDSDAKPHSYADANSYTNADSNPNSSDGIAEWRRKRKHFSQYTANRELRFYSELHGDG